VPSVSVPKGLAEMLRNRQRTSTKSGILKAGAAIRFARVLRDHDVDVLQDVPRVLHDDGFKRDIHRIPGQRSGVSLTYFFMLAGSDDLIKPDRMVQRFLTRAVGREPSRDETVELLRAASARLRADYATISPRLLDYVIWNAERTRDPERKRKSSIRHPDCKDHDASGSAADEPLWGIEALEFEPIGEEPDGSEDPEAIVLDDALDGWADYLHRKQG
jgi:hypothetical protein